MKGLIRQRMEVSVKQETKGWLRQRMDHGSYNGKTDMEYKGMELVSLIISKVFLPGVFILAG